MSTLATAGIFDEAFRAALKKALSLEDHAK